MTDHVPFCQRPHHHLKNWLAFHTPHPPWGTEKSKTTLIKALEPNQVLRKAGRALQQAKNYNTGRLLNNTQTPKTFNQWSASIPLLCVYPCESICMYSNTHTDTHTKVKEQLNSSLFSPLLCESQRVNWDHKAWLAASTFINWTFSHWLISWTKITKRWKWSWPQCGSWFKELQR